jgi:hypothetical protein
VEDGDAVRHGQRFRLVVRDVHDGHAELLVQVLDLELHLLAKLLVERAERLVHEHELGPYTSARASATRCCWPPESCEGLRSRSCGSRTISSARLTRGSMSAFGDAVHLERKREVSARPSCAGNSA